MLVVVAVTVMVNAVVTVVVIVVVIVGVIVEVIPEVIMGIIVVFILVISCWNGEDGDYKIHTEFCLYFCLPTPIELTLSQEVAFHPPS